MGKEHTTVKRLCTIKVRTVTLRANAPEFQNISHVCFTTYRKNKRQSISRSELIRLPSGEELEKVAAQDAQKRREEQGEAGGTGKSPNVWVSTGEDFSYVTNVSYTHDFCYPMASDDSDAMIAIQSVKKGVKRETIGTFTFSIPDTLHKPICRITFVASKSSASAAGVSAPKVPICTVDCEITNAMDHSKNEPIQTFFENTVQVEGQYFLPTLRKSKIDNTKDYLQQKKGELLERLSKKKQEKVLKKGPFEDSLNSSSTAMSASQLHQRSMGSTPSSAENPTTATSTSNSNAGRPQLSVAASATTTQQQRYREPPSPPSPAGMKRSYSGGQFSTPQGSPRIGGSQQHNNNSGNASGSSPTTASTSQSPNIRSTGFHVDPLPAAVAEEPSPSPSDDGKSTPSTKRSHSNSLPGTPKLSVPIVTTAQNFVSNVCDYSTENLESLIIWNPSDSQLGSKITMPSPSQLHSLGFGGCVAVLGRIEYSFSTLRAYLDELENRFGSAPPSKTSREQAEGNQRQHASQQDATADAPFRIAAVGSDALICALFRVLGLEAGRRPLLKYVAIIPVRLGSATLTAPKASVELLNFFAEKCVSEASKGDFDMPPTAPKDQLAMISGWLNLPRLTSFQFPLGVVQGTFVTFGAESNERPLESAESVFFSKRVVIVCPAGINMVFFERGEGNSSLASSVKRNEMKREPCIVGVLRVPSLLLPFSAASLKKPQVNASNGALEPPRGELPLKSWTTRHMERGLMLERNKTHVPELLQSSLYGKDVVKVVCSSLASSEGGGSSSHLAGSGLGSSVADAERRKTLLQIEIDGESSARYASSVTIAESGVDINMGIL